MSEILVIDIERMRLSKNLFEKCKEQIGWILFVVFEFAQMNDVDSQSHPPSKGTNRYRASADIQQEGERRRGGCRKMRERKRERKREISLYRSAS